MDYSIRKMSLENITAISSWKYEEPFSLYNIDDSEETINEFLSGNYYSIFEGESELIGYCSFGNASQVPAGNSFGVYENKEFLDVGFGMKPDLCGKGKGLEFIRCILNFAQNQYKNAKYRLTVANFNKRAIKVYEKLDFKKIDSFLRGRDKGEMEFYVMSRE